ncbi:MAG: alpha/beta hydrolase family protein [Pseudomonadales bacterium]
MIKSVLQVLAAVLLLTSCTTATLPNQHQHEEQAFDPVTMDLPSIDAKHPPAFHEVVIPSHDALLTGFLLGANGPGPHPTVVLMHGYPGNEKNLDVAQSMRRAGFNVLFFHYRGAWGSQGDYALSHLPEDVLSAIDFLTTNAEQFRVDTQKISLVGHSMGGFAALSAGAQSKTARCVVGIAAANLGEYADRGDAAQEGFKSYTDQLFMLRNFDGEKALADIRRNFEQYDVRRYGPKYIGKHVLLIAGEGDTVVPPAVQERIQQAWAATPGLNLRTRTLPGDHAFSHTRIVLQREVINWLNQSCR